MDAEARRRGCRSNGEDDVGRGHSFGGSSWTRCLGTGRSSTRSWCSKPVAGGRAGRCGAVMTKLEADDDGVDGVVVDVLVAQAGKEQGIAVGVAMSRSSGEAGTGSCRWLGHDTEQGGGVAMVRLQHGEAVVKAAAAGRSSRARRWLRSGGEGAALFKGMDG